jgi:hypothetical protein
VASGRLAFGHLRLTCAVVTAAVVLVVFLVMYVRCQLAIDGCLDHGGRWN